MNQFAMPINAISRACKRISGLLAICAAIGAAGCQSLGLGSPKAAPYMVGADLSYLKQAEDSGTVFKDAGTAKPGMRIFKDHGYNWVRLRLFNAPTQLPNNLQYTIAMARQAKKLGMKFLLDYHYSDTWADPGKQFLPKAWEGKSHAEMVQSVHDYTRDTVKAFVDAGAAPDMVAVGNEIIGGMLWPDGKLPANWDQFADLVKAGIAGVNDGHGAAPKPLIMIHIDRGGDMKKTKWFFDNLLQRGVEFDVIGQSYYPFWHGSLDALKANLDFMAHAYRKPIAVAEAAYYHLPSQYRDKPGPYPESPEGQKQFLEAVDKAVKETPDGLGAGVFYWEPAVANRGLAGRGMFDANMNALPVISVFDSKAGN